MDDSQNRRFQLADCPADDERLGIDPVTVTQFEDGQRIGTERGRYERRYFDAHLDDGATVVVVFYTKPNVDPNRPLAPKRRECGTVSRDYKRNGATTLFTTLRSERSPP